MSFSFDTPINRYNTDCCKYDTAAQSGRKADVLPMWIADMDFAVPDAIKNALVACANHGIFGYPYESEAYFNAVSSWFSDNFGWENKTEWIVPIPGVVFAISTAIRAFTKENDAVIILQPVYPPFAHTPEENGRRLVVSNLINTDGYYTVDYTDFEQKIIDNEVKLFILCSPHNPIGRVWSKEELTKMGEICVKHGVTIIADEIHADFVYESSEQKHTVFASINEELAQHCIVCTAPSKTFNIAGLTDSNIFIPNPEMREKFRKTLAVSGGGMLNNMAIAAAEAAYTEGKPWKDALMTYLQGNIDYLYEELTRLDMGITFRKPQGTYLLWLDCRGMGLSEEELHAFWNEKANIWLNDGSAFGKAGEGFMRMNVACPRSTLREAVARLEQAQKLL